jgi:hypothetical protein
MWIEQYSVLLDSDRAHDGSGYSERARDMVPRYNVLNAIRVGVERLDPDHLPSFDDVDASLREAAFAAQDVFTEPPNGEIEERAMDDERLRFVSWLDEADIASLAPESLPYWRVISDDEARSWVDRIQRRWPIEHGGWWQPIMDHAASDDALALHDACFWEDDDAGPATLAVRTALASLGVDRVVELREHGPDYEVALECVMPTYNGAEGLFTSGDAEWVIFASHEGVAALGGTIVAPFKRAWPDWSGARWTGL